MSVTDQWLESAIARHRVGQLQEAETIYRQILGIEPGHPDAMHLLGVVANQVGRPKESIECITRAIRLRGNQPMFYYNLGEAYRAAGMLDESIGCYRQTLALNPADFKASNNMAGLLRYLGDARGAIDAYRQTLQQRPEEVEVHSNLLYTLNLDASLDPQAVFAEHREWARRHAEPLTASAAPHTNDRTPERRLKLGYVSGHFRQHAVSFFVEPILASHDRSQFEVTCYSNTAVDDETTTRLKGMADQWRDIRGRSDAEVAEQVRADRIDILVDLAGHIDGNRLLVFARRPAPVQVTYLGYQNSTGMSAMDYRLTDAQADPPGLSDALHTERLVRLPRSFFCYRPSDVAPLVGPLPAATNGHVTFGSFNNFTKVGTGVLNTWWEILKRVPGSRLVLLAEGVAAVGGRVRQSADAARIDPERIELADRMPLDQYLRLVQRADIALDPFPFNGHTTTCDSIWMGVPVVMLAGRTYASRFGGSVLTNVGLDANIAQGPAEYVERAVGLAGDLTSLAALRAELRGRMNASALLDFAGFTRNVELAYRQMWRVWCQSGL